jgi:dolichyl-phosphate beta-glucosyltransferase
MNKIYLSVVIPMYNEEKNLKRGVLLEVENYLKKQKYTSEVIISDDQSTDKSILLAENFVKSYKRFRLLKNKHGGKPFAIRSGVLSAKGEICLFIDMDLSTPIKEVEKLLPFYKKGFDLVIASRGRGRKGFAWYRQVTSVGFRFLRRALILPEIIDTQCGFKSFKRKKGKEVLAKLKIFEEMKKAKGWKVGAWDVELLFVAKKMGLKIKEVEASWQDRDVSTGKRRNFLKESKEMLLEILRVRLNDLKGAYA